MKSFFIVYQLQKPEYYLYHQQRKLLYSNKLNLSKFENIHCIWLGSVMLSIYKKFKKHRDL